ncbi:MAG: ABC transporter permease [Oligoflexia bacterium]
MIERITGKLSRSLGFSRDPWAFFFFAVLMTITGVAVLGPVLSLHAPDAQQISQALSPPSAEHWFGTDLLGRDLLARVLQGARFTLLIGIASTLFALILGTLTGSMAGYWGGWIDRLLLAVIDFFSIFPSLLMAILFSIVLGRGMTGILLSIGVVAWVQHARLVRAQVIQAREMSYVESAQALGLGPWRILLKHVLPNLKAVLIVSASAQIPSNILAESFLSFLGLGIQPPFASWGTLAAEGARALRTHPHLLFLPGGALFLTLLSVQYLGDWLTGRLTRRDQSTLTSRR